MTDVDDEAGSETGRRTTKPTSTTAVALGAGVLGAIQPKINAVLGARLDSAVVASMINFLAAFAGVVAVLAVRPGTRHTLRKVSSWPVPRWTLTAGLAGVLIVLAGAIAVDTIGVAIFSVAFFAGQIVSGLVVDRLGVGGEQRPIAPARVQAAVLANAAVGVSQLGRPVGEIAPALVALVVVAGAASAFQAAFNGRIAGAVGDPFAPTAVNVIVGLLALIGIVTILSTMGRTGAGAEWPSEPWLYLGGLLGVSIVLSLAIASAALGVLRATLAMLAAQLIAAFVVDGVVQGQAPTPGTLAGAVLIVLAVVLVGRSRST